MDSILGIFNHYCCRKYFSKSAFEAKGMSSYKYISIKKFYNIIGQVAVLIIPFILTLYVSRVLGASNIDIIIVMPLQLLLILL